MKSLKIKLEDLNECMNKKIMINLIYEIVLSINDKKGKDSFYSFESSENFDLVETFVIKK